ncbi:sensor domain-containing diguanylate cyclase [Pseudomonas lalucatii]|uniref:diguanylate cyclase n=1 Tax=Pseudomonas lalucatii TaxID=1424203 RepID=A0ABS5PVT7_9PSED|nr:sensor domain-containing diguanylate cyclase [Pseudomonas lalucatii]MBS7660469.1 sensor domain-containing diguanylate cyclase [Pseudomonas lalucatii]MBS7691275.1 sensor domain-containing diguanylate cyclase [Pseudomonas lalucatii]MBS7724634.1 sensor domain-containing diguanylate cyclase [Pseudomonas lalucatii]QVM87370.1 sensor domain-containing diguanylate cyclase [Pseudomonas lalucatii]
MNAPLDLNEFHWLMAIVQSIDVGVVMLDRECRIEIWNSFMENHSGRQPGEVHQQSFFTVFPEVDEAWFRQKLETVSQLGTPAFTIWEQRPYLMRFKSYQPITGQEDHMFQNVTLIPLRATDSEVAHICVIIYDVTEVAVNKRQLQSANRELKRLSSTDRLTGLNNRGHWEEALRHEYARHQRYQSMAALVMFDIDHFKKVNDSHGHQAGDKVIKAVAELVLARVRTTDVAGRYGGEEFAVLLPDTDAEGGRLFAERLRLAVEAMRVEHDGVAIPVTISLGVADLGRRSNDYQQFIEWADHALYDSKKGGRNRTSLYHPAAQ